MRRLFSYVDTHFSPKDPDSSQKKGDMTMRGQTLGNLQKETYFSF